MDPNFVVATAGDAIKQAAHQSCGTEAAISIARGKGSKIKAMVRTKHSAIPPYIIVDLRYQLALCFASSF